MTIDACLDETVTNQLVHGKLPEEIAESAEEHLLKCDSCLARVQAVSEQDDELLAALRAEADTTAHSPGEIEPLVEELEKLGSSAQIAASAHEEIRNILGKPHSEDELGRLAHFRILEVLGAGGMGIVFKAEDGNLNRIVAVKAMRPSLAVDPEAKHRFRREAMAVAAFEHDHVVTVYQVEEDNGIPFFAMQWLEGESLRQRLQREGKLTVEESLRITREIATGLAAAHDRGLLHRDIKPDNVWLQTPNDRVKILDFGLVRSIEERSSLTHSGAILGTPEYMAPEQACGEDIDERCDLFSVGCVLYHMLTGQPPFRERNVVATLVAVSNAKVEPPHTLEKSVPHEVSDLATRLLKREPQDRVPSAQELIEKTTELESGVREEASSSGGGKKRLLTWLALGAAALFAGIIALQTPKGTLYVDADASVTATIAGDSDTIQLADKATGKQYKLKIGENRLRTGEYEIVVRDEKSEVEFSSREFSIRRGEREDVRVWLANASSSGGNVADAPTAANVVPIGKADAPGGSPSEAQILDMLEQDPGYLQLVTSIQQEKEKLKEIERNGHPNRFEFQNVQQSIARLEKKREELAAQLREPIIERIRTAASNQSSSEAAYAAAFAGPLSQRNQFPDGKARQPELPSWLTGSSDRLALKPGEPLSPLALVQHPGENAHDIYGLTNWTIETNAHRGAVSDLCTSPSGEFTATAGADGTVRIWQSGKLLHVIVVPDSEWGVGRIAWSGNGTLLAATTRKSLTIWDVSDMRSGPRFQSQLHRNVHNLAWSDETLALSDADGVHIWAGSLLPNAGMTGATSSMPWSTDGRLLGCREKETIRIWDMTSRQVQSTINIQGEDGFSASVTSPVFATGFNYIAMSKSLWRVDENGAPIPDDDYAGSRILIYDATTGARLKSFPVDSQPFWLSWNPESDGLTYIADQSLHTIDLNSGETSKVELPTDQPLSGTRLRCLWARSGNSKRIHLVRDGNAWRLDGDKWTWLTGPGVEVEAKHAADRVAARIYTAGERDGDGYLPSTIDVWWTKDEVGRLASIPATGNVQFELPPVGNWLCTAKDSSVHLVDMTGQSRPTRSNNLKTEVGQINWSPDGRYLVAITASGAYNILDGENLETLKVIEAPVVSGRASDWIRNSWRGELAWAADSNHFVRPPDSREYREDVAGVVVSTSDWQQTFELGFGEKDVSRDDLAKATRALRELETELAKGGERVRMVEAEIPEDVEFRVADFSTEQFERLLKAEYELGELELKASSLRATSVPRTSAQQAMSQIALLTLDVELDPEVSAARFEVNRRKSKLYALEILERESPETRILMARDKEARNSLLTINDTKKRGLIGRMRMSRTFGPPDPAELTDVEARIEYIRAEVKNLRDAWETQCRELSADSNQLLKAEQMKLQRTVMLLAQSGHHRKQLELQNRKPPGNRGTSPSLNFGRFAWSPDGHSVAVAAKDRRGYARRGQKSPLTVMVWNLRGNASTPERRIELQQDTRSSQVYEDLHFSADGQHLAVCTGDAAFIINLETGKRSKTNVADAPHTGHGWLGGKYVVEADGLGYLVSVDGKSHGGAGNVMVIDPQLVGDRILSTTENGCVREFDASLKLVSTMFFQRTDDVTSAYRVFADGRVLPGVPPNESYPKEPFVTGLGEEQRFQLHERKPR